MNEELWSVVSVLCLFAGALAGGRWNLFDPEMVGSALVLLEVRFDLQKCMYSASEGLARRKRALLGSCCAQILWL